MSDLVDIFGPSASDSAKLAAIFGDAGSPDFSDVSAGASSTADDPRRKKRAELAAALAAQKGAPNAGLGATPLQSVGDRAAALGDRFVSGAADTIASIPEGVTSLWNKYQGLVGGDALQVPEFQYPTIGTPGGFLDLKAQRADIARQAADAQQHLLASEGDPEVLAAADTLALGAGMAIPIPGLHGAGGAVERTTAGTGEAAARDTPLLAKIFGPPASTADAAPAGRVGEVLAPGPDVPVTQGEIAAAVARGVEPAHPGFGTPHDAAAFGTWLDRAGLGPDDVTPALQDKFFEVHHPDPDAVRPAAPTPDLTARFPDSAVDSRDAFEGGSAWGRERPAVAPDETPVLTQIFGPSAAETAPRPIVPTNGVHPAAPEISVPTNGVQEPLTHSLAEIFGEQPAIPRDSPGVTVNKSGDFLTAPDLLNVEQNGAKGSILEQPSPVPAPVGPPTLSTANAAPTLRNLLTREEVPLDTPTTGTKNAVTEAERVSRGLPEVDALARKTSGDTWAEARQLFEADPEAPRYLAQRIAESPRTLTPVENDLLLHDRMKLTLDHREALAAEDAALQAGDQEGAALAKIRRTSIESAMDTNDTAAKLSGTEWSAAGSARQKLIADDYSPLYLRQRLTVAAREAGAPEIPGAADRLTEISRQLDEAHQQLATYEQRLSEAQAAGKVRAAQGDVAAAERSGVRRAARQTLDAEYEALGAQLERKARINQSTANMSGGLDPETVGIIGKMAKNRVQAGARGLGEVVDGIYQTIRPHIEGLEPSEVRDAISGYGVVRPQMARSEAVQELARVRQEARVLAALEDARAAGKPARELAQLERQAQLIAERQLPAGRGPLSDAEHLAATKSRLARREAELTQHIANDYFPKRTRRPLALDSDAIALQGRVNGLKRQADLIIRKQELAGRTGAEKAMDYTAGWGRFLKLTGVSTLQKISAAAAERSLVFRPIEEMLGAGWSKAPVVKHFAGAAPIEGGGSLDAVAKSYSGFFGKAARREMAANFAGKEGPMELALSTPHLGGEVPEWMSYPGRVHAGLKSPAKIAGYEYAMQKQAEHYLRLGQAEKLADPGVIAEMKAAAWEHAHRDIFMGDNAAVGAINRALGDTPGQSTAAKAGKTLGRVVMPIVKVPTNYALEATDYLAGLPKAGLGIEKTLRTGRAALAKTPGADQNLAAVVKAGLDSLPPGQAERIMRQLKKGSLGAGLISLGATGAVEVGGYYDGRRGPGDLQPGQIRIAGHAVPHMILHHPALEALQVGGTIFRAHSLVGGLGTAAKGLAENVPFIETPVSMARDLWGREPTKGVGSLVRGMTIPPDVQRAARVGDQTGPPRTPTEQLLQQTGWEDIQAKKRKPRGSRLRKLVQEEELGIPGLRENVR